MPKLKRLSGEEVIKIFKKFNFEVHSQKGSHIKLRRIQNSESQILLIPNHKEIDTGTLRAIIRQDSRYIVQTELNDFFL
jgi:predicted RNA binding protein YcfA (HicA-like mRNA interferase family)